MMCFCCARIFRFLAILIAVFLPVFSLSAAQDVLFDQGFGKLGTIELRQSDRVLSRDPTERLDYRLVPELFNAEAGSPRPLDATASQTTKIPWLNSEIEKKLKASIISKNRLTELIGVGNGLNLTPFRVVEPNDAVDEIVDQIQALPEPEKLRIVSALSQTEAETQQRACTVAVRDLREPRIEWNGATPLANFSSLCFGDDPEVWLDGTVNEQQRTKTRTCAIAYENYRRECLGQGGVATLEQEAFVGVLTRRVGATSPRQIICTVTFVDRNMAVTAAHCVQDLRVQGARIRLSVISRTTSTAERPVIAVATGPGYDLLSVEDLVTHLGPLEKQDDIAFVFFKSTPQDRDTPQSTILFPLFSRGEIYHPTALVGFQPLAERAFVLDWLQDTATFLDDEALLESGAWEKFLLKESTAHCMPIKPMAADAGPREIGHQCQSFSGTSGAPLFNIRDGSATFEIGALHTFAAELEGLGTQAINEGVLIPEELGNIKAELQGEFLERFEE